MNSSPSLPFIYLSFFFFFNDTATTEIYTLSLHDALPISARAWPATCCWSWPSATAAGDRKSTRLNSSHDQISYAVFCLKKKKKKNSNNSIKKKKKKTKILKNKKKPN